MGWADCPFQSLQVISCTVSDLQSLRSAVPNTINDFWFQSGKHACTGQTVYFKFYRVWYWNKWGNLSWIWNCNTIISGALHSTWRTGESRICVSHRIFHIAKMLTLLIRCEFHWHQIVIKVQGSWVLVLLLRVPNFLKWACPVILSGPLITVITLFGWVYFLSTQQQASRYS